MAIQIQAALIGAISALLVVLLRDIMARSLIDVIGERRERRKAALAVYRAYADPLAAASTSLFWRLREVFYEPGRTAFLSLSEPITEYQRYKKDSTIYRIAALLGWIRGLRRELSFFTLDDRTRLKTVEAAISELESALADGRHEEMRRIEKLGKIWTFELPYDTRQKTEISVEIENAIKTSYHLDKLWEVRGLSQEHQAEACGMAVDILTRQLNQRPLAEDVLKKTHEEAIEALSVRESWLYRDLQAAVGDLMLSEITSDRRRFEVKGYAAFLELTKNAAPERLWTDRLYEIFHELDICQSDDSDARILQLRKTLVATAKLLVALAEVRQRAGSVSDESLATARAVIKDCDYQ